MIENNTSLIEELIIGEQYKRTVREKEQKLLSIIKEQLQVNMKNIHLKKMYEKLDINIASIDGLSEVPYIPVKMFKLFDLVTCDEEQVARVLNSSATSTGTPSKIYIDKQTSIRQSQALISTLQNFLGSKRRPLLVIDSKNSNKSAATLTARGAAIRGVSSFANKIYYVLKEVNGELELDIEVLKEFEAKYHEEEILVYGFTYMIWTKFVKELQKRGITIRLPRCKVLHSGGWKNLLLERVSKSSFSNTVAEVFQIDAEDVIDFYGMVEQLGILFIDCECGYKHVPDFAEIIIRDFTTLKEVAIGEKGMIEVMSILASSYPAQAILTEDVGELIGVDDCPCGRRGKYFKFIARVEKSETRGCGDTFAERERNK